MAAAMDWRLDRVVRVDWRSKGSIRIIEAREVDGVNVQLIRHDYEIEVPLDGMRIARQANEAIGDLGGLTASLILTLDPEFTLLNYRVCAEADAPNSLQVE